jgi:membrane-associated phospholipid phosphatase
MFREPRPENPLEFTSFESYKNEERYGMPSGHAQSVFFSIVYLYNIHHSIYLLLSTMFVGFITLYQRWKYRRHTIQQLIVGSAVGSIFAWSIYSVEKYINK